MQIFSLIESRNRTQEIEIEVSAVSGPSQIMIVGCASQSVKESAIRIQSALRVCGIRLPVSSTLLVNLRPTELSKSSSGIDLAIVLAILIEIEKIEPSNLFGSDASNKKICVYGGVGLKGDIIRPKDTATLLCKTDFDFCVCAEGGGTLTGKQWHLRHIGELFESPNWAEPSNKLQFQRPKLPLLTWGEPASRLVELLALWPAHALVAGPPGSGKTTLSDTLWALMKGPRSDELSDILEWSDSTNTAWRPKVQPHHTMTYLSIVGGGSHITPGEMTRAHLGLLVLDEYLEFSKQVQEALREPLESSKFRLVRAGQAAQIMPCAFQMYATANLCPCGRYLPNDSTKCRCSSQKIYRSLEKISGPATDRIDVIAFSDKWREANARKDLGALVNRIEAARDWIEDYVRDTECQVWKRRWQKFPQLEFSGAAQRAFAGIQESSLRRSESVRQAAIALACLENSSVVEGIHIEEAKEFCIKPHQALLEARSAL
ncbi:MAG: hypothetical protein COT74_01730 [Bdellovibrionales bacterium CG10_big_fil_rev_8_21_14_0_10_45_34]|nr:MAG: hypothetical protein COT74_01730 [Bdellovibrionales bacterium CG10_big_fil_rev_8_21_14_0_10_45_34]